MAVIVAPIADAAVPAVSAFLHEHLNPRVPVEAWAASVHVPWSGPAPNHGYQLLDDGLDGGTVVGAYLAYYCERVIDGRPERFCNLGAWCVLPAYRHQGLRLLTALLAQDGYAFTDLSPSGPVVDLNQRLRFEFLDTTTALIPNLPWPGRRGAVVTDPARIEAMLAADAHAGDQSAEHELAVFRGARASGWP